MRATERLTAGEVASYFNVSRTALWKWRRDKTVPFPEPDSTGAWTTDDLNRWAVQTGRSVPNLPVIHKMGLTPGKRTYLGATRANRQVVLRWETPAGRLGLLFGYGGFGRTVDAEAAAVDVLVDLRNSGRRWHSTGPEGAGHERSGAQYSVSWDELSAAVGGTPPWFPSVLASPSALMSWRPALDPVATLPVSNEHDVAKIAEYARAFDGPARELFLWVAARVVVDITDTVEKVMKDVTDWQANGVAIECSAVATDDWPADIMAKGGQDEDLDDAIADAGLWHAMLRSPGTLGEREAWFAYTDFAGSRGQLAFHYTFTPRDCMAAEDWVRELEPHDRVQGHDYLDDQAVEWYRHPRTGALATRSRDGRWHTHDGKRVPSSARLQEVHLGGTTAWVMDTNGDVFPIPGDLSWGYRGSGPINLATSLHAMLTDIAVPAQQEDTWTGLLTYVAELDHAGPHVLSRALIEQLAETVDPEMEEIHRWRRQEEGE